MSDEIDFTNSQLLSAVIETEFIYEELFRDFEEQPTIQPGMLFSVLF
jgi:hypothetical protein